MTHNPRKRFGQNFLQDHSIINNIISSVQTQPDDHWVEIGPGLGALTEPLLKKGVTLDVVELDRDLVSLLNEKFSKNNNLTIHSADALQFDFSKLISDNSPRLRVIGNLPYNISTPLMFHLLDNTNLFEDMHFMLQKEVVERICAVPGSKQYGRLSVMMQYYCEPECLFYVPPESFSPIPNVMSAVIRLIPHTKPPVFIEDLALFKRVVSEAFSQRRKTLRNSLKKSISEQQIIDLNINPAARAENITLAEFARLSNLIIN